MRRRPQCPSFRHHREKLECNFRWKWRFKCLILIVLSKLLSLLILIFHFYSQERF